MAGFQIPISNQPLMTGSASAPISVTAGGVVSYVLKQTDQDVFLINGQRATATDMSCWIAASRVNSMERWQFAPRSIEPNGTITWDISGIAVASTVADVFLDIWVLYNNRSLIDIGLDPPVYVAQTVTVTPAAPHLHAAVLPQTSSESMALMMTMQAAGHQHATSPASDIHLASHALRQEIQPALTAAHHQELQGARSVSLPLHALSAEQQNRCLEYARGSAAQLATIAPLLSDLDFAQGSQFELVLHADAYRPVSILGLTKDNRKVQF